MPRKKPEPKKIELTAEQELVVAAKEGAYRVAASPGSGKSSVLVQRYIRLLQSGVSTDSILSLTFTSTAAKNLRDRVEERVGKLSINRKVAGACTFHSLCLSLAVEERAEYPFELEEFPLATEPVAAKFSAIAASKYEVDARSLRSAISLYKRKKIRPAEAVRIAENNLKAAELKTALAYKMYDKSLRDAKVLDFDSLILEAVDLLSKNKEVRDRWQYQFVMCDECQDCSQAEWELLKLVTQTYGNIMVVGDPSQCHPPDTMIAVTATCVKNAKSFPLVEKPISELKTGDTVVPWSRRRKRLLTATPRKIEIEAHFYEGPLLTLHAEGRQTRVTPDHKVWVRHDPHHRQQYVVYLMWRPDYGFRVGKTLFKSQAGSMGVNSRAAHQEADRAWVLKACSDEAEALYYETLFSVKFNIPETMFPTRHEPSSMTEVSQRRCKDIFEVAGNHQNGMNCLQYFGLLFDCPLFDREKSTKKFRATGYYLTAAANIIPGLMRIPLPGEQSSSLITQVETNLYKGLVYSMNVEQDHTYSADGLVVGNCIYAFRGSDSSLFMDMEQMFPGTKKLFLGRNFRSTPEIVSFVKEIGTFRELCEHFTTENEHGPAPLVRGFATAAEEAQWIVKRIKESS